MPINPTMTAREMAAELIADLETARLKAVEEHDAALLASDVNGVPGPVAARSAFQLEDHFRSHRDGLQRTIENFER